MTGSRKWCRSTLDEPSACNGINKGHEVKVNEKLRLVQNVKVKISEIGQVKVSEKGQIKIKSRRQGQGGVQSNEND